MIRRTPLIAASVVAVMTLALALGIAMQATGTASADVTDDQVSTDPTSLVMVQPAPTVQLDTVYLAAPEDQAMDTITSADDDDDREADEHDEDGADEDHDGDGDDSDDHDSDDHDSDDHDDDHDVDDD